MASARPIAMLVFASVLSHVVYCFAPLDWLQIVFFILQKFPMEAFEYSELIVNFVMI